MWSIVLLHCGIREPLLLMGKLPTLLQHAQGRAEDVRRLLPLPHRWAGRTIGLSLYWRSMDAGNRLWSNLVSALLLGLCSHILLNWGFTVGENSTQSDSAHQSIEHLKQTLEMYSQATTLYQCLCFYNNCPSTPVASFKKGQFCLFWVLPPYFSSSNFVIQKGKGRDRKRWKKKQ